MAITDLTGTKWKLSDDANAGQYQGDKVVDLSCTLKANDNNGVYREYDFVLFGTFGSSAVPKFMDSNWISPQDKGSMYTTTAGWSYNTTGYGPGFISFHEPTIEITGGAGATDADVIAWFEANATQIADGANNKVVLGDGTVVMDITDTTAEEADVVSGKVFYKSNGTRSTGSAVITPVDQTYDPTSTNAQSGTAVAEAISTRASMRDSSQANARVTVGTDNAWISFRNVGATGVSVLGNVNESMVFQKTLTSSEYVDAVTGDLASLTTDNKTNLVSAINEVYEKSGEPFRVKNWAASGLNVSIPYCTEDLDNTSIPKMDFSISDEEGAAYQVVGMVAYEVKGTDGKRINCWPVCQFTGNGQKTLSVRWMCAGTSRKTAAAINAWVLLKHR